MWEKFRESLEDFFRRVEMSSCAYVEDAADFAKALTLSETLRAGDYGKAMRRVGRKVGVAYSTIKRLHYGAPKTIDTADFVRLGTAYAQRRLNARDGYTPRTALGRFLVGAADALDRVADAVDSAEMGDVND